MKISEQERKKAIATFRFGIISEFVTGVRLERGERNRLLAEKAARTYEIPFSRRKRIARSSILRWMSLYRRGGNQIEVLYPRTRRDKGGYRKLRAEVRMAVRDIRKGNARVRLPGILRELKKMELLVEGEKLNRATLYRFLRLEKLKTVHIDAEDKRQFEASLPNELWQSDVMHGPYLKDGSKKRKSYLIAVIDDFSRLIIHAAFYSDESLDSFRRALYLAISCRGIPHKLYIDNGACFRAHHLDQIAAAIGFTIHHSRPYTPQGRGKIERWFRTVRDEFLSFPDTQALHLDRLNEALDEWVAEYNSRTHSTTNMTPLERYRGGINCIRPAPPNLNDYFRRVERRLVRKDRTFRLMSQFFEAPVELIDRHIEIKFFEDEPSDAPVEIFFDGKSFGNVRPVNPQTNAKIGRDWSEAKAEPRPYFTPRDLPVSGELELDPCGVE